MAENISRKKLISDIPTLLSNLNTTIRAWANGEFSKTNHTHTASSIGIPLFAPDFSKRIKIYSSEDDSTGYGFRIRNCDNTTNMYPARIFQLKYPCFIYTEIKTFGVIDTDMILEMCANKDYVIACNYQSSGNASRFAAAKARDNTYITMCNSGSQNNSFLIPLGTVNYWHHYTTGAIGSHDDGDHKYRDYYIVPAYGTPTGTALIDLYSATYAGKKQSYNGSEYWLNYLKTSTFLRTVTT